MGMGIDLRMWAINIYFLIRLRKMEQVYTFLQTRTKDTTEERMTTLERSLATLVHRGTITPLEAEKRANHPQTLIDELQRKPDTNPQQQAQE